MTIALSVSAQQVGDYSVKTRQNDCKIDLSMDTTTIFAYADGLHKNFTELSISANMISLSILVNGMWINEDASIESSEKEILMLLFDKLSKKVKKSNTGQTIFLLDGNMLITKNERLIEALDKLLLKKK